MIRNSLAALVMTIVWMGGLHAQPMQNGKPNGPDKDNDKNSNGNGKQELPKTLFEWAVGPKVKDDGDDNNEPSPIVTNRPDFSFPSTTVGLGRVVVETGYLYLHDRQDNAIIRSHYFPELLIRMGLCAEWFEFQIGQSYGIIQKHDRGTDERTRISGATDMLLGINLALTSQKGWLPETGLHLIMTVPVGGRELTGNPGRSVNPAIFYSYLWEVKKDCLELTGTTGLVHSNEDAGNFMTFYQTAEVLVHPTKKLTLFTEFAALVPHSALEARPSYFIDAGFLYLITPNVQIDGIAGVGLNQSALDFFLGTGISFRY